MIDNTILTAFMKLQWLWYYIELTAICSFNECPNKTRKKLSNLFNLLSYCNSKKGLAYWKRHNTFVDNLFFGTPARMKHQQKILGVKMANEDHQFYANQKEVPEQGYCTKSVDRIWEMKLKQKQ